MGCLDGKVAVITGSGAGIGRAIAMSFAHEGATVVVNGRHAKELSQVCHEINRRTGKAIPVIADATREKDVRKLFDEAQGKFGRVDIAVNCVGLHHFGPFLGTSQAVWEHVFSANIGSAFLCAKVAGEIMTARTGGNVIFISSIAAFVGMPNRTAYCASKGALVSLTKALSVEWRESGIRVNCIAPGFVLTERVKRTIQEGHDSDAELAARVPLTRRVLPEEVAEAAVFLASSTSNGITGQTIMVDGGWTAA